MKKLLGVIISISVLVCSVLPICAISADKISPALESISFSGATIDDEFSPAELEYTITLSEPSKSPTLESYKIDGSANIFVTYSVDESNHQDGIIVKLENSNGATYYSFKYSNAVAYEMSDNNFLKSVNCKLGEVYPQINKKDTGYKLYIPSDLTEISISVAAEELSSSVDFPSEITLNESQEPIIPITVTASNGEIREYSFKVKRLSKSTEEIIKDMQNPNFKSIVYGELLYQKPEFKIGIICAIGGILIIALAIFVAKRIMIKVGDDEENEFFE